jgi:hypothetical protein
VSVLRAASASLEVVMIQEGSVSELGGPEHL